VQRRLERPDLLTQRGLRDVQAFGGPGEAQLLRDGPEVPQVAQVRVHSHWLYQRVLANGVVRDGHSFSA